MMLGRWNLRYWLLFFMCARLAYQNHCSYLVEALGSLACPTTQESEGHI
jgi:hypothetical protein